MSLPPNFEPSYGWSGRPVLITGADGFIGSHLTERLLREGALVSVWVRPRSVTGTVGFELRNLGPVQKRLGAIVASDIAGADAVDHVCDIEPAVIFHLAPMSNDRSTTLRRSCAQISAER